MAILGCISSIAFADTNLEEQMLRHVEKITVIDTVNVRKTDFFRKYKLPGYVGNILSGDEVDSRLGNPRYAPPFAGQPLTGYSNEFQDYMIWSQEDTTGYLRLAESMRKRDGSWSTPEFTPNMLNFGAEVAPDSVVDANAAFPFLSDDGQTLYFAADNDKSLGGYDIFIATRDPSDGEFLIPRNLGMPFNSPFNDYMMVLDSPNGIGWWASDRNQLDDEVTIYIFAISDSRVNVDPDDENLMAYATLSGWQNLLDEDGSERRLQLLEELAKITPPDTRKPDFELQMPGGSVYRYFSDFKSRQSAELMKGYLAGKADVEDLEHKLAVLRRQFHDTGDKSLGHQILSLEGQIRFREQSLKHTLSEIYKIEKSK